MLLIYLTKMKLWTQQLEGYISLGTNEICTQTITYMPGALVQCYIYKYYSI